MEMFNIKRSFLFVIYPKALIIKGQYSGFKLPQYTFELYKGDRKEDEVTIVPTRQQKLYYKYFILEQGKLQFQDSSYGNEWQSRRIVLYDHGIQVGSIDLNIEEYVSSYQQFDSKTYEEKFKMTDSITFEFEVFIGTSSTQVSELMQQYGANSTIKTPLTNQSRNQEGDMPLQTDSLIYNSSMPIPNVNKQAAADEEESANQSVNTEPVVKKYNFTLQVKQVPVKKVPLQTSTSDQAKGVTIWSQFWKLPAKDKISFFIFGTISIVMIYLSMFPVRRI